MAALSALEQYLSGQQINDTPRTSGPVEPTGVTPSAPSRSAGEFLGDTAIAGLQGLGAIGDDVAGLVSNRHVSSIEDWLENYKSTALKLQEQQEAERYAREQQMDQAGGVDAATRIMHGLRHFMAAPVQNVARGAGYLVPGVLAAPLTGGASLAAELGGMGVASALHGHNERMASDPSHAGWGEAGIDALTGAAFGGLGRAGGAIGKEISNSMVGKEALENIMKPYDADRAALEANAPTHPGEAPIAPNYHDIGEAPQAPINPNEPAPYGTDMRDYTEAVINKQKYPELKAQYDKDLAEHSAKVDENAAMKADYDQQVADHNTKVNDYIAKLKEHKENLDAFDAKINPEIEKKISSAASEGSPMGHPLAQFAGRAVVDGLGGGSISAASAALNNMNGSPYEDAASAFGEGMAPGVAFGAAHNVGPLARYAGDAALGSLKGTGRGISKAFNSITGRGGKPEEQGSNTQDTDTPAAEPAKNSASATRVQPGSNDVSPDAFNALRENLVKQGIDPEKASTIAEEIQSGAQDREHFNDRMGEHLTNVTELGDDDELKTKADASPKDIGDTINRAVSGMNDISQQIDTSGIKNKDAVDALINQYGANKADHLNSKGMAERDAINSIAKTISPEQYEALEPHQQLALKASPAGREREDLKADFDPAEARKSMAGVMFKDSPNPDQDVAAYLHGHQVHQDLMRDIQNNPKSTEGMKRNLSNALGTARFIDDTGRSQYAPGAGDIIRNFHLALSRGDTESAKNLYNHWAMKTKTPIEHLNEMNKVGNGEEYEGSVTEPSYFRGGASSGHTFGENVNKTFQRDVGGTNNASFRNNMIEEARLKNHVLNYMRDEFNEHMGGKEELPKVDVLKGIDTSDKVKDKTVGERAKQRFESPIEYRPDGLSHASGEERAAQPGSLHNNQKHIRSLLKRGRITDHAPTTADEPGDRSSGSRGTEEAPKTVNAMHDVIADALKNGHDIDHSNLKGASNRTAVINKIKKSYGFKEGKDENVLTNPHGQFDSVHNGNKGLEAALNSKEPPSVVVGVGGKTATKLLKDKGYENKESSPKLWTRKQEGEQSPPFGKGGKPPKGKGKGKSGKGKTDNSDSTSTTSEGKSIFLSGSRNLKELPEEAKEFIHKMLSKGGYNFFIGDAQGIDSAFHGLLNHENAKIYHIGSVPRQTVGGAPTQRIKYGKNVKAWEAQALKDMAMVKDSHAGIAVWDGKSTGTLRNIYNLSQEGKSVRVYLANGHHFDINDSTGFDRFYNWLSGDMKKTVDKTLKLSGSQDTDSRAGEYMERTKGGNFLHRDNVIDTLPKSIEKPHEVQKPILNQVSKETAHKVVGLMDAARVHIGPAIEKAIDSLPEDEKYYHDARSLLGSDGKIDPKIRDAAIAGVLDTLFNMRDMTKDRMVDDAYSGLNASINTNVAVAKAIRTTLRIMGADSLKGKDDVNILHVERPLANLIGGIYDSLQTWKNDEGKPAITLEISRRGVDAYGKPIKGEKITEQRRFTNFLPMMKMAADGHDIPVNWISNMLADSEKNQRIGHSVNKPVPVRAPLNASKELTQVLKNENSKAYKVSSSMAELFKKLTPDTWAQAFMPKTTGKLPGMNLVRKAVNQVRINGFKHVMGFVENTPEDSIYYDHGVARNTRIMALIGVTPQGNKTARFAITPFNYHVSMDNGDLHSLPKQWRMAAAQALGIKVERQDISRTLEQFPAKLAEFKHISKAIENVLYHDGSAADFAHALKGSGVDEHAVAALTELVRLEHEGEITSHLGLEVDGVTNGPAAGLAMFGNIHRDRQLMAKGGIYVGEGEDGYKDNQQDTDNNQDLYITAMNKMPPFEGIIAATGNRLHEAIKTVLENSGDLKDGIFTRDFMKQPIQMATYLAGDKSLGEDLQSKVIHTALDLVDQGKLNPSILRDLGVKVLSGGKGFEWDHVRDLDSDSLNTNPYFLLGSATRDAVSHAYPSDVDARVRTLGFAAWTQMLLARTKLQSMLKGVGSKMTYAQRAKLEEMWQNLAPKMPNQLLGLHYTKSQLDHMVGVESTPALPIEGIGAKQGTNYRPSFETPRVFRATGQADKGPAVASIQSAGDGSTVARASLAGDLKQVLQIYDGYLTNPGNAFKLASKLNEYWSENATHLNPFDTIFTQLQKTLKDFYAADKDGSLHDEFMKAWQDGSKDWNNVPNRRLYDSVQQMMDNLEGYKLEQDDRNQAMQNENVKIEQFTAGAGDKSKGEDSQYVSTPEIARQNQTKRTLEQLQRDVVAKMSRGRNPVGHAISDLIGHNQEKLRNINIHTLTPHNFDNIMDMYGFDKKLVDKMRDRGTQGAFVSWANDGNGALFIKRGANQIETNRTMIHELTHAMISKNLAATPADHPSYIALRNSMNAIKEMGLTGKESPAASRELKKMQKDLREMEGLKFSEPKMMDEFAARFLESPSLIKLAMEKKLSKPFNLVSRIKDALNAVGKMIFGDKFSLGENSIAHSVFTSITDISNREDGVSPAEKIIRMKDDPSDTREHMYHEADGTNHSDELLHALYQEADRINFSNEAKASYNDLRDQGWKFTPKQYQAFKIIRSRLEDRSPETKKFLRDYASKASELIDERGADYLGTSNQTKNLLALIQTHPEEFEGVKAPGMFGKNKSLVAKGSTYGQNVDAWNESSVIKAADSFGGITREIDRRIAELIGKHGDDVVEKVTGRKHVSTALHGVPDKIAKVLDKAGLHEAVRELGEAMAPVTEKKRAILATVRQWKYALDRSRQSARSKLPHALKSQFKGKLTNKDSEALFRAARTDIAKYDDWKDVVRSHMDEPLAPKMSASAKQAADDLAHHLATGEAVHDLHANADVIAHKFGGDPKLIDKYIGKKAYTLLPDNIREHMSELLRKEEEGVETIFGYHQNLQERNSKFGNEAARFNALKGYMPNEMQDSSMHIAGVERGSVEHENLKYMGYNEIGSMERNRGEKGEPLVVMSGRFSGNTKSNQGGLARIRYTVGGYNMENKGTTDFPLGVIDGDHAYSRNGGMMRPIFDGEGRTVHYERQFDLPKKLAFSRHNDIFQSLGAYEGNLVEMGMRDEMNQHQLDALKADYQGEDDKSGFINVATTKDPVIRQVYDALPKKFHEQAAETFGKKGFLPVRRSMVNDILGYKKASVGDFWTGDTRWSPKVQKAVVRIAHAILGEKAYQHLMRMENLIEEGTGAAQRMIAVASVRIPVRNMCNDILQLLSAGVSLRTIATRGAAIAKDLQAYNKSSQNIYNLKAAMSRRELSADRIASYQRRIQVEEDRIKNLSTYKLIQGGMYSVVDDGLMPNHSSSGMITPYIDAAMSKLPPGFDTVARNLFATQDSHLFRAVQQGVETTDFIARALTYEHNLPKIGHDAAFQKAMDAFVDYGRPKGRTRDKLESIGSLWFWNTKLRSLNIAATMFRDNPLLSILYSHMPVPTHIGMLNNLATPLTDNILSQTWDGAIGHSLGWGSLGSAWRMNPFVELMT